MQYYVSKINRTYIEHKHFEYAFSTGILPQSPKLDVSFIDYLKYQTVVIQYYETENEMTQCCSYNFI